MEGSASNDQMLYKDCTKTCSESFCNNDFDSVAELFSTGRDLTCYSCKYLEYFDGAVSGNKNCGDNPDLIPGTPPKCPVFADAGCFTGTNAQYVSRIFILVTISSPFDTDTDAAHLFNFFVTFLFRILK